MEDLFATKADPSGPKDRPLADRLRPAALTEIIGQDHLLSEDGSLTRMLAAGTMGSLIFWGPPGVGKTTIARLLAGATDREFVQISAIFSGVPELRKVFDAARLKRQQGGRGTLLFVDEIHRFNKAQQDGFLPHMEDGTILLVGATTENPSFELNAAVLSRAQVLTLRRLDAAALEALAVRAEEALQIALPLTTEARAALVEMADGDGRALLNLIEQIAPWQDGPVGAQELGDRLQRRAMAYDKAGDEHYNLISALHKSVRGSDPDAALYWLARMLTGGEDPRYLMRRITRMSVEDIGLADPDAQRVCLDAWQTYERLGSPEGELALAQSVIYLALAPKSNAAYVAYKAAMREAKTTGSAPPPKHILNAPTKLMKDEGYAKGYAYDHDAEDGFSGQNYFPDGMARGTYYEPVERGHERELKKRLEYFAKLRARRADDAP